MDARGLLGHVELRADLAVRGAAGDEREDLALARREAEGVLGRRGLALSVRRAVALAVAVAVVVDAQARPRDEALDLARQPPRAETAPRLERGAGGPRGRLAVVGWGSTFGAISQAVQQARGEGHDVSHIHLRYLNPFPRNLGDLLKGFQRVLVPEMNNGQLVQLLRGAFLIPAQGLNKVAGKPFKISEVVRGIRAAWEKPA